MGDLKGIFALFTACILLGVIVNFFFFFRQRNIIRNIIILSLVLFINQSVEFAVSFWNINHPVLNLIYIVSFNFSISLSSFYLLENLQPGSKHNWKAFMFSIMLLPIGFVYMNTFRIETSGLFFAEFRYFASPMANIVIGLFTSLWGIFFLAKILIVDQELRKLIHYKILMWGYLIPVLVYSVLYFITINSVFIFESLFSKLLMLNIGALTYFAIKTKR